MSFSSEFLRKKIMAGGPISSSGIKSFTLQPVDLATLHALLQNDTRCSFFKACASIADALIGLDNGMASWAVVNLYYSVFYCARCRLEASGEVHIYFDRTPYSINTVAGSRFQKGKGTSHAYAHEQFEKRFPSVTSLSQTIGVDKPFPWLRAVREDVQYSSPFTDNEGRSHRWNGFVCLQAKALIKDYLGSRSTNFAFDPDHAAIAFPLFFFVETATAFANSRSLLDEAQQKFLVKRMRLANAQITELVQHVRELTDAR